MKVIVGDDAELIDTCDSGLEFGKIPLICRISAFRIECQAFS